MFASFFNMLYPSKTFLSSVLNILYYDPTTYNIEELNEQMNAKEQCDLLNGTIDVSKINEKLPLKKFIIHNILIKKTNFVFKRNFSSEKTKLFFENIIIDIYHKIQDENNKDNIIEEDANINKEEKKDSGGFLNNVINVVVHNLEVGFKNITLKFYDKENKEVAFTLFIKNIDFKEAKDVKPIATIDKGKYLFIHNKAVYLGCILLKEKYDENDEIFFEKIGNEEWFQNYLKNKNCIFYMGHEIEWDIFHDKDNALLTIGNINTSKFYFENILNTKQLTKLYQYFIKNEKKEEVIINKKKAKTNNEDIDIMGFKIKQINIEMKIDLLYLILYEENKEKNIKEKQWISIYEKIIKEDESKKGINIMNKLIEHFNKYNKKYYIFCINNFLFKMKDRIISIDNISLNIINEDINNINNEQDDLKIDNIIQITNLKYDSSKNELLYDNIYFEINNNLVCLFKVLLDNISKNTQVQNKIADNVNDINIKPEEKNKENNNIISTKEDMINPNERQKIFKICGQNLNIKIFLDKNIEETIDKMTLDDIFKERYELDYINFLISKINIDNKKDEHKLYDKFELTYNDYESNKVYPIIYLKEELKTSEIFIDQNDEMNINLAFDLYFFINPKVFKLIFDYFKYFSKLIKNEENINKHDNLEIVNNEVNLNNCFSNCKFNLNINNIKIILIEGNIYNNIINNDLNEMPQDEIIYEEKNNYICFNFNKLSFKFEKNKEFVNVYYIINSFIIQDNICNSKYKIMLSNYDFKNLNEIFLNCDLKIVFNNNINKFEIKPNIKIAPLAIYLDQVSLYFILNIINQITSNKENIINNNDNNDNNKFINNDDNSKYVISNIKIQNFFIELNYNTNNYAAKEYQIVANQITSLLNTTSINKLRIIFQNYITEENKYLSFKEGIKNIYEFYSNDMIKQISGSFISALPLFYHIYDSIDGILDIVREPMNKYDKNESLIDGLVEGVNSWVVKTATIFTYLGESIGNLLNFKGCAANNDDIIVNKEEYSTFRQLRHLINETNKEKEEYYLKW